MSDLEELRARIPGYAGYDDTEARHQVDKQVRAYLGEALAEARDRLEPSGEAAAALEALLLRCEFSNPAFIIAEDEAEFDGGRTARVHAADRAIVAAADRIRAATSVDELGPLLDDARGGLDAREAAVNEA